MHYLGVWHFGAKQTMEQSCRQSANHRRAAAAARALAEAEARRAEAEAKQPEREVAGRGGLEPVRYGDWEVKGLASDF